jgi:NAD(P)-dependent dehydrogenase (short-subunit alcohol dehydrogenase family)
MRILVTGSSDGIGAEIARVLEGRGHGVVRHARDEAKAARLRDAGAGEVVVGDLASLASTRAMAAALSRSTFDVVVHNAGWLPPEGPRPVTEDGLERTFQVNALSAYLLTALLPLPSRLVYVSSDAIARGRIDVDDLQHETQWTADSAYADSKLAMTAIAFAVARRYPSVRCNAVHPGWIRTKMSGNAAPLDLSTGADTPVWLSTRDDLPTGQFFHNRKVVRLNDQAYDEALQDALLAACAALTGATLP